MTLHDRLRARATVSIWLGELTTEDELSGYLRSEFSRDFGFEWSAEAGPETCAGKSQSVRDLLQGFSEWERFIDGAVNFAAASGRSAANAAVVFYGTRYDDALVANREAPLQFLGAVEYSDR